MSAAGAILASCSGPDGQQSRLPDVEEATIADLSKNTARANGAAYLARYSAVDKNRVNSIIEINPDWERIANQLDSSSGKKGPLHGIPILLKDNIDTADAMRTTAGSLALVDAPKPKADAAIVARLREAGALILGKTNLSEWANIRSNRSTSGWSARGGQTRNPYALDRSTSGSSSGSGAAAAASLCAVAIGTETDGSIVSPSSLCGLVGIKPTVGLLSGQGIIPISHTQDTAGPMARTVRDAALVLGAMAGKDYSSAFQVEALRGARIGVCRQMFLRNPMVTSLAEAAIDVLRKAGAEVIDPVEIATLERIDRAEFQVLMYELKADMGAYLESRGGPMRSLADLIRFNEQNARREMPYFGQETFLRAQEKGDLNSTEYKEALAACRRLSRDEGIDAVMNQHQLDALFAPTDSPAFPIDWLNGDHFTGGSSTLAAVAGYPHITVPGGLVHGLPVGVSFMGRANSEERLIGLAYAYEQRTKHRRKPRYLSTVEFQQGQ
ncbi:amidase [Bryobacterales bacterium F-183]|nr:amidase [Bryobacterales bacterium F-183]